MKSISKILALLKFIKHAKTILLVSLAKQNKKMTIISEDAGNLSLISDTDTLTFFASNCALEAARN